MIVTMTGAKDRMREKKMKNQPRNVIYTNTAAGRSRGQGSQAGGWVRGHQAGGHSYDQHLPKYITASLFAKARAAEVKVMLKAVNKATGSCHVFAALPKHMRRRAMSHNNKRLPSRLRDGAQRLMERSRQTGEKDKKQQPKRKSRKARRRHGNLLLEFNRRQRKNKWLETHIWHAKRFHMLKMWEYSIPDRPTAKSFRASYRAMNSHCLLQDLSYFSCLELQGSEEQILRSLARLTSKDTGPSFASAVCLSGQRQGSVHLYRSDQFPHGSLGPAVFLWRPRIPDASDTRQLWIWIHPALKQDVLAELQSVCECFDVAACDSRPADELSASRKRKRDEDAIEFPSKKLLGDGTRPPDTPVCWRSRETGITLTDLSMEIVRFRLIGPLSHIVLTDTLQPANESSDDGEHQASVTIHQQQRNIFHTLRGVCSSAELPAGCVLGLTVNDPRLTLPQRRSKHTPDPQQGSTDEEDGRRDLVLRGVPVQCSQSSLWDGSVRERVTHSRISEQELNSRRSGLLVPGSRLVGDVDVPVLLVHQAGRVGPDRLLWGSGWDLLLPKGWAAAFWVPLVYRGVRVGGLHMSVKHSQIKGLPHFPHDYPETPAGSRFQSEREAELLKKFKRRPPSKRTNYIKYGCLAPFRCPWQQLTEEWEELARMSAETWSVCRAERQEFCVLRSLKVLRQLSVWCRPSCSRRERYRNSPPSLTQEAATALQAEWGRSLVWVCLRLLSKGHPALHAMVCEPTSSDLQLLQTDGRSSGPQEPRHKDHLKHLLKRKSQTRPSAGPAPPSSAASTGPAPASSTASSAGLVSGVWPEPLPSVVSHCSRLTLGWVLQADFSLAAGCGEALAFVSVSGLLHMLLQQPQEQRGVVLLRNPSSLQYRYAQISIDV